MEELTPDRLAALDVALDEATLLGVEMDVDQRRFATTLAVWSLPADDGPPPDDPRIQLVLEPVGRLLVSMREARWNDRKARSVRFGVDELADVVASFHQLPIFGREFFDKKADLHISRWAGHSLNLELGEERAHTLDLFQEGNDRYVELRVWFDGLTIRRLVAGELEPVSIDDVGAAGVRWWNGLFAGDPRTDSSGIIPLK